MKTLDRRAAEIFRKMLALQTTKIDNSDGTYMPVHIELIGRIDKYDFFSLAHCGIEQNSVRWSEDGIALNPRLQAEHTTFANQWLRNIAAQQGIL